MLGKLDENLDEINGLVCQLKAALSLVTWLDACGESSACHGDIMTLLHRCAGDVRSIESLLENAVASESAA